MTADRDISHWYDKGDNALQSHLDGLLHKEWKQQLDFLWPRFHEAGCKSLLEFGSGAGMLATAMDLMLNPEFVYLGVEKSVQFLKQAKQRASALKNGLIFVEGDVRTWSGAHFDCVCAFKFLKHFDVDEWDDILGKILEKAKYAAFDVQLFDRELDNGKEFPHVFVCEEDLLGFLDEKGYEVMSREVWSEGSLDEGTQKNVAFWTRRRE